MRNLLIVTVVMGILVVGVASLRNKNVEMPVVKPMLQPVAKPPVTPALQVHNSLIPREKHTNEGELNEGSNSVVDQQDEDPRKSEGTAGELAETESLTSIYQGVSKEPSVPTGVTSNEDESNSSKLKPSVMFGVPIDSWVLSQRNAIAIPAEDDGVDGGLRVYLWCMELKRTGLQYHGPTECDAVLPRRRQLFDRGNHG